MFAMIGGFEIPIILIAAAFWFILPVIVGWLIASKAGYPGVAALLLAVPLVNVVVILIFALSEWPIERKFRALSEHAATAIVSPS
jgi:hypothetical protein